MPNTPELKAELGFKPDTRSETQQAMAQAVATLGTQGDGNSAAVEGIRSILEKDSNQLYRLLGGRKK